jgi:TonB family protein
MLSTVEKRSRGQLFYKWTFPGAPIRIEIALNVVARLEGAIGVRNKGRTAEIGGILIGEFRSPNTVGVTDYVLIEPEPGCEHSYVADALELERLCAGRDSSIPAGHIVGYFRTQREPALELRDEDVETTSKHFKDSRQIILLISHAGEESTAGFLFWDGGAITPFSFLEFPFSAELLGSEAAPEVVAALPEELPAVHVNSALTVKISKTNKKRLQRNMPLWLLLVLTLALALGFFKLQRRRPSPASDTARPPAMAAAAPRAIPARLELQVEAEGKGLNVRWNPQSDAIAQAAEGKLTIFDNKNSRAIGLNAQQLTSGHVFYQPGSKRVEFQLVVIGREGKVTEESVLALLSKTEDNASSIGLPGTSSKADQDKETARSIHPVPKVFTIPLVRQSATKADPIIIKDASPEASVPVNLAPITIPVVNPGLVNARVAPAPPPVAERPQTVEPIANRAVPESKPTISPAELFHDAVVKTKVSPVLPQGTAPLFPVAGSVEVVVRVHIDERGGVTGAEVVSKGVKFEINRRLETAAINAAKQWRFEPARLNDKPVSVDYYITFVFQHSATLPVR